MVRRILFSNHQTVCDSNHLKPRGGTGLQSFVSKPTLFTLKKTRAIFYQSRFKILTFEWSEGLFLATTRVYVTQNDWILYASNSLHQIHFLSGAYGAHSIRQYTFFFSSQLSRKVFFLKPLDPICLKFMVPVNFFIQTRMARISRILLARIQFFSF